MKDFLKYVAATIVGVLVISAVMTIFAIFYTVALLSLSTSTKSVEANSVLEIDLSKEMRDYAQPSPMRILSGDFKNDAQSLVDLLNAIELAKTNKNVKGIYIKGGISSFGRASGLELRRKIQDFKSSGKFVYAYADHYSQQAYYVASVADSLFVNPVGGVDLTGLSSNKMFLKGTLDKLGVEMQVFKVGSYKSAVEPYLNTRRSEADRIQTESMLRSIWGQIEQDIMASRKIESSRFSEIVEGGLFLFDGDQLVVSQLADKTCYGSDLKNILADRMKVKRDDVTFVSTSDLLASMPDQNHSDNRIAILFAEGEIDTSAGGEGINSTKMVEEIEKIEEDDNVKALVLRINSPGGSAFGSEQMWHRLRQFQKKKPIIVSMGDYAASGGYYMAVGADAIVASPMTLTGSIGVFGVIPNMQQLSDKVGLSFDVVKTHQFADFGSINRPMNEAEKRLMQNSVEKFYSLFLKRCAEGRSKSVEAIDSIAQGRVWSGSQALSLGLIDQLGGLDDAIRLAAQKADVKDYRTNFYPAKKELIDLFLEELNASMKLKVFSFLGFDQFKLAEQWIRLTEQSRIQAIMEIDIQ